MPTVSLSLCPVTIPGAVPCLSGFIPIILRLLLLFAFALLGTGLGTRGWEELHLRVFTHEHGKLLLLLLGGVLEGEVIEDVLQGLGSALRLEELDGVYQVGQHVIAEARIGGGHGGRCGSG